MSKHQDSNDPQKGLEAKPRGSVKKRYQKPAFRHEQIFETMALACGKVSTTQAQCRSNRKNS